MASKYILKKGKTNLKGFIKNDKIIHKVILMLSLVQKKSSGKKSRGEKEKKKEYFPIWNEQKRGREEKRLNETHTHIFLAFLDRKAK